MGRHQTETDLAISIHSPCMGRDRIRFPPFAGDSNFNPLSLHGERRFVLTAKPEQKLFQSTLPAWGETGRSGIPRVGAAISIHSPRMGRDRISLTSSSGAMHFNPLSPHGERRGAVLRVLLQGYFNPLSPHGERPSAASVICMAGDISIHSPRMGRDTRWSPSTKDWRRFQSTLPAWGETSVRTVPGARRQRFQSTLPAWGETGHKQQQRPALHNFNPLSPHGERPPDVKRCELAELFQSTLPAWGETGKA